MLTTPQQAVQMELSSMYVCFVSLHSDALAHNIADGMRAD
jgi:hypothetical protein